MPGPVGVRWRLLVAFLGISAFAVLAAAASMWAFLELGRVVERTTEERAPAALALLELSRQAERIAAAAYPRWRQAMDWLWRRAGVPFALKEIYPEDFLALAAIGHGVAGSPASVRDYLARLERETGINYVLCQMVFGDMNFSDAAHSIELFAREVMPAFK